MITECRGDCASPLCPRGSYICYRLHHAFSETRPRIQLYNCRLELVACGLPQVLHNLAVLDFAEGSEQDVAELQRRLESLQVRSNRRCMAVEWPALAQAFHYLDQH